MQKLIVVILLFFHTNNLLCQIKHDFSRLSVTEEKVDSINFYYNKVLKSKGTEKKKFEKLFLKILPINHYQMSHAMYIDAIRKLDEYEKKYADDPRIFIEDKGLLYIKNPWVKYLSMMDYFDKEEYYQKYFSICIGGEWGADYMVDGFEIYERFLNDTKIACQEMSKLKNSEIKSVFWFIFDGPHPRDNEFKIDLYKKMSMKIEPENKRIAKLLSLTYKKLLKVRFHDY